MSAPAPAVVLRDLSPSDLFERLACAAMIVRDTVPAECGPLEPDAVAAAFTLLEWARDHAGLQRLRDFAFKALFDARVGRPMPPGVPLISASLFDNNPQPPRSA